MKWIASYVVAAGVFGLLDFLWLGLVAKGFYRSELGSLLSERPNMFAALAFYALYVVGVVYFAVAPALADGDLARAGLVGALLGLVAYATWNLTNLAVIDGFPARLTLVDMAWGTTVTAVTSLVTVALVRLTPWA